jgi:DNA-binding NtrC family response regulator
MNTMCSEQAPIRILIVDDEPVISDTLRQVFAMHGYAARVAYSAEQATEIVSAWVPDLIIIDVILPQMNGIELAILFQEHFPRCRVILFSGQTATADLLIESRARGHKFEILAKPVHPQVILNTALRMLTADKSNQRDVASTESGL